jgi:hypothetical protein
MLCQAASLARLCCMIRVHITGFFHGSNHEVDFTSQAAGWINQVVEANRTGFPIARAAIEPLTDGSRKRRDLTLYDLAEDLASLRSQVAVGVRWLFSLYRIRCGRRARKGRSRGCRAKFYPASAALMCERRISTPFTRLKVF